VEVFYDFMMDAQGGEVAMNYAADLLKRLKEAGLQITKKPTE